MTTENSSTTGESVDHDLVDALSQSAFSTMGVLTRLAAEHDLSLTLLRVLAILRDRRLRMSDLVDHLGLEKSTLTGLVSRAESRGLIERSPHPLDRRAVDVALTDAGRTLAGRLSAEVTTQLQPRVASLSRTEQGALAELLTRTLAP